MVDKFEYTFFNENALYMDAENFIEILKYPKNNRGSDQVDIYERQFIRRIPGYSQNIRLSFYQKT